MNAHADSQSERRLLWREFKLLTVLIIVVALAATFVAATSVFLLIFGGILIAILLHAPSAWLCRHTPLSTRAALAVVVASLLVALAGTGWLTAPRVLEQATQFAERVPEALDTVDERITSWLGVPTQFSLRTGLPAAQSLVGTLPNIMTATFGVLGSIVVVVALGLYLAAEPVVYRDAFVRLFTPRHRDFVLSTLNEIGDAVRRWLYGQFVSMVIVGILAYIGLRLLGVPLALGLAILTALLDFVPYIGAIAAAVPVGLVAFAESPALALYALGVYTAIQLAEGYLFVPLIQKRAIHLPPGIIIASQVLLGLLFGFIGIVLATPLCAAASVAIRNLYIGAVLEKTHGPALEKNHAA